MYTQNSQNKTRYTFYTENTPKDGVATADKNNIVYQIDCSMTVVTVKYSTSVKLSELKNRDQMNTKDTSKSAIVKGVKLRVTVGKKITTLTGIKESLLMGKASQFLGKSKKLTFFELN